MFNKNNSFFEKILKINSLQPILSDIKSAYYLGGFKYSSSSCKSIEKAINEDSLKTLLSDEKYDSQEDNIELYLIVANSGQHMIIIILDLFELYM